MSNVWRIFIDDMRLAKDSIISIVVILGLCLVPAVCAWLGIVASWDPYANTGNLKVAVANGDEGYESDLMPIKVNIGERVTSSLHGNDEYGWTFVNEGAALEGVRSGEYYAAIIIPQDFSRKLMTGLSTDAEHVAIDCYLNLKESPDASVLAGLGEAGLPESIRATFAATVDEMIADLAADLVSFADSGKAENFEGRFVTRLSAIADDLDAAANQVRTFAGIADTASSYASTSAEALSVSGETAQTTEEFIKGVSGELDSAIASARSAASRIDAHVQSAKADGGLEEAGNEGAAELVSDIASLTSSVQSIERSAEALAESLDKAIEGLSGSNDSLTSDLSFVRDMLGTAANRLGASASKVRKFRDDVASAITGGSLTRVASIIGNDPDGLSQWLAAPVRIERHEMYPAANFGSSVAAFYTALSIWIGAIVLVVVMRTGVSDERIRRYEGESGRKVRGSELYLGRFLIFALLSLAQATVVGLGDVFFLQVQCAHPLLFLVACWAFALVSCSIVYALVLLFGGIGKALCIALLVVQIVGLGGEYPIQMMGGFFQVAHALLPSTYGTQAMQASIAGMHVLDYVANLAGTMAFLPLSLLIGLALRRLIPLPS